MGPEAPRVPEWDEMKKENVLFLDLFVVQIICPPDRHYVCLYQGVISGPRRPPPLHH